MIFKVSTIVCAYTMDRLEDTKEAVDSLLKQSIEPHQVIVSVDNNEKLFHRLKLEVPSEVKVFLNNGIHGLSESRNVGIRNSTGDIVALIDDDAVADSKWLENLLPCFEKDPNVMVVGGESISVWPKGKQPCWFPDEFDWTIGCTAHNKLMVQENSDIRNVTGSNMAFRKEVFDKVGFWETDLGAVDGKSRGGEEANICLRIKSGIEHSRILYEPRAVVFHKIAPSRATLGHLLSYCWDEGFNRAKMRKATSEFVDNPLSEEISFLRKLLTNSIGGRMIRFYKVSNIAQAGAIILSLISMGTTYLMGRTIYR